MTDMAELQRRKQPLNLAIVHVDPQEFLAHYRGWLEITHFIKAQSIGEAVTPADGVMPPLTPELLRNGGVHDIGNDTVFAFCMAAALKGDKAAVDRIEAGLLDQMGPVFPGSFALWHFRGQIDAPRTLEDFVGQAGKKMLTGDIPPPPLRAKENWGAGLRFFEKARKSNFVHEIMYPLARWTRAVWTETAEKGVAFLHHIEDNLPVLREVLGEPRNDQPFIANCLLRLAPAVDMALDDEYQGLLRSLARRG